MGKRVFSILVDNNSGLLSRVAGLFSRRGYNIESITAGVTADPRFTRITLVTDGDEIILTQIENQLRKLEDVRDIKVLEPANSILREIVMVKLRVTKEQRADVIPLAEIFKSKIVDVGHDYMVIELIGTQSKLEAFIELMEDYEILELARTGVTGLSRGTDDVKILE
jgi:acetolactate synthase-1/3 small subunit